MVRCALGFALGLSCLGALGQNPPSARRVLRTVREVDDPSCGLRWYLLRDLSHPGGPGSFAVFAGSREDPEEAQVEPARRTIVFAGDRLIVEERTAVLDTRLEAVALRPASAGQIIDVRWRNGGKSILVRIVGPGRARLLDSSEVEQ
jgi:hypothetical protein